MEVIGSDPAGFARPGPLVFLSGFKTRRHGGEGGIRTHDTLAGIAVFETARFSRLRTSPRRNDPYHFTHAAAAPELKKSTRSSRHSASRTPATTSKRWLRRSVRTSSTDARAPHFGSAAP